MSTSHPAGDGTSPGTRDARVQDVLPGGGAPFKTLLDNMQAGVVVLDADRRVTYANPAAWTLFDVRPDDVGYRPDGLPEDPPLTLEQALDAVRERIDDAEPFFDRLRDCIHNEIPDRGNVVTFTDGTVVESTYVPVRAGDETVGHLVIHRDVTEQHEAQRALHQSRQRWRRLIENHPAPTYVTVDGRFAYVNSATVDLFGAESADDLIGREVLPFAHPDVRDRTRDRLKQLLEDRQPTEPFEHRVVRLDGEVRTGIVCSVPIQFRGQRAAQTMVRDVTEQRRTKQKLRDVKELYENVVESMPVELALFDAEGQLLFTNARVPDWLDRREHRGRTLPEIAEAEFGDPEKMRRITDAIEQAVETQSPVRFDSPATPEDDDRHYLRVVTPGTSDGEVSRVLTFHLDITGRHRAETQLQASKTAAEDALRAKEQFFSAITHELRTPLHAILGLADLLEATGLSDKQARYLDDLCFSAENLLDLINDLLDLSRLDTGRLQLRPQSFSPADLTAQVVDTMRGRAQDRGTDVTLACPDAVPDTVVGDPTRLKQMLWNLLSNAIDAAGDGHVEVRVAPTDPPPDRDRPDSEACDVSVPDPASAHWIAFSVSDDGPGIPEADRERIFDSFVQLDRPGDADRQGSGLGLAIVHSLTRSHGGTIDLDSTVGEGSTFTIRLPFGDADEDENLTGRRTRDHSGDVTSAASAEPSGSAERTARLTGARILVVEDTPSNRMLMTRLLTESGADVTAVSRGQEAFDAVREDAFDAVLVDVQLPQMDGFEVARRMREDLGLRDAAIIAVSASIVADLDRKSDRAGVDGFLQKPFHPRDVAAILAEHLRPSSGASPDPDALPPSPDTGGEREAEPPSVGTPPVSDSPEADSASVLVDGRLEDRADAYGVDPAFVVNTFLDDAQAFLDTLQAIQPASLASAEAAAEDGGGVSRVRSACHDLRSSAHLVGADPLHRLLKAVDEGERPVDAGTLLALRVHCRAARDAARSLR